MFTIYGELDGQQDKNLQTIFLFLSEELEQMMLNIKVNLSMKHYLFIVDLQDTTLSLDFRVYSFGGEWRE